VNSHIAEFRRRRGKDRRKRKRRIGVALGTVALGAGGGTLAGAGVGRVTYGRRMSRINQGLNQAENAAAAWADELQKIGLGSQSQDVLNTTAQRLANTRSAVRQGFKRKMRPLLIGGGAAGAGLGLGAAVVRGRMQSRRSRRRRRR
jgi:hypothetical protein